MATLTTKKKPPCNCKAYAFPHRPTGGACEDIAQEIHSETPFRKFRTDDERKADQIGVPAYGPL